MGFLDLFSSKPKAAGVPLMPRWKHLEALSTLLQDDLDHERQELALGHVSRLYELIRSLKPADEAIYYSVLSNLQKLIEKNEPRTRKDMLQYVRVLNGKERQKAA